MTARPRRLGASAALAAAFLALTVLLPDVASASTRVCRQLEAELAGGGKASTQSRRNDAAVSKQRAQLQAAKRQARASGCGFRLFGGNSSSCGPINAKIEKLERSVAAAQRKASSSGRSRAQIMAALRANGCRDGQTASTGPRNLLEQIFGGGVRQRQIIEDMEPPRRRDTRQVRSSPADGAAGGMRFSAPPGRYRTLCVRTCDGYYYPLSTSSRPSDFARDQANCQTSCPASAAEIYYTRPDEEANTMVSGISGQPYIDLPSAFLYKQVGVTPPEGCTCNAAKSFVSAGGTAIESTQAITPPEPQSIEPLRGRAAPEYDLPSVDDRRVRVVGPVFLPDPEGAADPQAPAPSEVQ